MQGKTPAEDEELRISSAEVDEFSWAFDLYARLDEARGNAARLRSAAERTTGLEREANLRQAVEAEAGCTRIEAELAAGYGAHRAPIAEAPNAVQQDTGTEACKEHQSGTGAAGDSEEARKRRIELIEEDERTRLSVRSQFEREQQAVPAKLHPAATAPARSKRETQHDRVERCLAECECRAAKLGESFDRRRMPGTKADLLKLLHAYDPALQSIKSVESLDRYAKNAGCKWPLAASAQPTAVPLFARLFPSAHFRVPGAVSSKRRKT